MQIIIFDGYAVVADRIHSVVETGRGCEGEAVEFTDLTALASKEEAPSVTADAVPPPPQAGETGGWAFPPLGARATHDTFDVRERVFASEAACRSSSSFQVRGGWYPHSSRFNASTLQVSHGVPDKLPPGPDEQYDPAAPVSSAEKGAPVASTSDEDEVEDGREWHRDGKVEAVPDHVYDDSAEAHDAAATGTEVRIEPVAPGTYAAKAADMDGDDVARLLKVAPAPQNERGGAMPEVSALSDKDKVRSILEEDWPADVPSFEIVARIRREVPGYESAYLSVERMGALAYKFGLKRTNALALRGRGASHGDGALVASAKDKEKQDTPPPSPSGSGPLPSRAGEVQATGRSDNLVRTASMGRAEPARPGVPAIGRAEPASIPFVVPSSASPGARKHGIRVMALSDEGMTDGEIANDINNSCGANDRVNTALVKSIRIEMERIARHDR